MGKHIRLSAPGPILGAISIAVLAWPSSLAAQEPVSPRAPAAKGLVTPAESDIRVQIGSRGDERRIAKQLTRKDRAIVADLGRRLREGGTFESIRADWTALVRRADVSNETDADELANWVLREAHGDSDSDQMANVDLQSTLQRQQQATETMANISKALHDSAMSIIRKTK